MKTRVLTAVSLIPVVLAAVFVAHPGPLGVLLLLVTWIASAEMGSVAGGKGAKPIFGLIVVLAWVIALTAFHHGQVAGVKVGDALKIILGFFLAAGFGVFTLSGQQPGQTLRIQLEFSSLWIAAPLCSLLALHSLAYSEAAWNWKSPVLIPLFALWAGDTAAIFAGKYLGKHLLAPKISPKKTVEGAVANFIFCILGAMLGGWIAGVPMPWSIGCGVVAGLFGQAGDLFQSAWKRKFDKKDSGSLLPGHGGLLDRIDSLLFTAPLVTLILAFYFLNPQAR